MKRPDVTIDDFKKMAVAEGHNLEDFDMELTAILLDEMNRSYNMGYAHGLEDGRAETPQEYAKTGRVEME